MMATQTAQTLQTETERIRALTACRRSQQAIAREVGLSRTTVGKIQRKLEVVSCAVNPSRFKPGHRALNPRPNKTSWKKGQSGNPDGSAFLRIPIDTTMREIARDKRLSVQDYLVELHRVYYADHKAT
jgi:DNA-binding XRE family transcriptional regulator